MSRGFWHGGGVESGSALLLAFNITKSKGTYRKLTDLKTVPKRKILYWRTVLTVFSLTHFKVYFCLSLWCTVLFRMPCWLLVRTCRSFLQMPLFAYLICISLFFITSRILVLFGTLFYILSAFFRARFSLAQIVKFPPALWENWVRSFGWKDPLKKGMGTHSSILAWRIPWTEKPGRNG